VAFSAVSAVAFPDEALPFHPASLQTLDTGLFPVCRGKRWDVRYSSVIGLNASIVVMNPVRDLVRALDHLSAAVDRNTVDPLSRCMFFRF